MVRTAPQSVHGSLGALAGSPPEVQVRVDPRDAVVQEARGDVARLVPQVVVCVLNSDKTLFREEATCDWAAPTGRNAPGT